MTLKEVMEKLVFEGNSKYSIAKSAGIHPIMIDRYLKRDVKTIRRTGADGIKAEFGIEIEDRYINGCVKQTKKKLA